MKKLLLLLLLYKNSSNDMGKDMNDNKSKDEIRAGRKRAAATAGRNKRRRHREVLDQRSVGFQETKSSRTPLLLQTRRSSNHKFLFCNDQKRDIPSPGRISTRERSKHRDRERQRDRERGGKRRESLCKAQAMSRARKPTMAQAAPQNREREAAR
jgi:hypothetical protein